MLSSIINWYEVIDKESLNSTAVKMWLEINPLRQ